MIALGLLALTALAALLAGLQVWLADRPSWVGFKVALAGLATAAFLMVIFLGKEFHLWSIDGEFLDQLAIVWIAVTLAAMVGTYWTLR